MCTSVCRTGTPPGSRKSICWCCTACATASISSCSAQSDEGSDMAGACRRGGRGAAAGVRARSGEHTSELQSLAYLVLRPLLEKKKKATGLRHEPLLRASTLAHG